MSEGMEILCVLGGAMLALPVFIFVIFMTVLGTLRLAEKWGWI